MLHCRESFWGSGHPLQGNAAELKAAGAENRMNKEEMIRLIKDIGENPAKRNTAYEIIERF